MVRATDKCIFCGKARSERGLCLMEDGHAYKMVREDITGDKIGVPVERELRKATNQIRLEG